MARRRINPDRPETGNDEFERGYADLRGAVWRTQGKGDTWEQLAEKANLSLSTVANFAYGNTRRPHMRTAVALALACGFRTAYVPAASPRVEGELNLSPAERGALKRKKQK